MNNDNYFVIQGFMVNDLKLSGTELMTYAIIYGFSQDGESWFKGSRPYIAGCMNVSLPTVDKALKSLEKKGLIIQDTYVGKGNNVGNKYKVVLSAIDTYKESLPLKNLDGGSKESLGGSSKESLRGVVKNLEPINIDNKNNIDNIDNKKHFSAKDLIAKSDLSEPLKESLMEFVEYKKQNRKPYKELGLKKLITEVKNKQDIHGDVAVIKCIDNSIVNNYQGISWWMLEKDKAYNALMGNNESWANSWANA